MDVVTLLLAKEDVKCQTEEALRRLVALTRLTDIVVKRSSKFDVMACFHSPARSVGRTRDRH